MAKKLDKNGVTLLTNTSEAKAKTEFSEGSSTAAKAQAIHKASGLPLWVVEGFLNFEDGTSEIAKVNIASATAPEIRAMVPLTIQGDLLLTPYISGNRVAYSYTVVGALVAPKQG